MVRSVGGSGDISLSLTVAAECPDQSPELQPWNPGHDQQHRVYIGQGRSLLLTSSATVHSVHISEGGMPASPRSLLSSLRWDAGCPNWRGPEPRSHALGSCQSIWLFEITTGPGHSGIACLRSSRGERSIYRAESLQELGACQLVLPSRACLLKAVRARSSGSHPSRRRFHPAGWRAACLLLSRVGRGLGRLPLARPQPRRHHCVLKAHPVPASSGKLVIKDHEETIVLRTRHILIDSGGELHAGSARCPFQGNFSIVLYGRWVDSFSGQR